MPRDGAIIFSNLTGKLDAPARLINQHGRNTNDPCGARFPGLPAVL
jgi:hypothetical protein